MTKEELMALLRDPGQTGQAVDDLNRLIEENPYFHTGHQLYLKGLQQTDERKMALQLGKTALSVRDRGVLYNYINRPSSFRRQPAADDNSPGNVSTPFVPGNSYVSPEAGIHNIRRTQPSPPSSLTAGGGWQDGEEHIVGEEEILSDEQLMDMIRLRLEQIGSHQTKGSSSQASPEAVTETETAAAVETAAVTVADNAAEPATDTSADTSIQIQVIPDAEIREQYSEEQLVTDLIKITPINTGLAGIPSHDVAAREELPHDVAAAEEKKESPFDDLISSFLKANPKIIPGDSRYEVDLSESLREDQNIATETLADIYATQGHPDKAIEIYEHLILKYPEKRIYFAAQIERLKLKE